MSKFDGNNEERSRRPGRPEGSGHNSREGRSVFSGKCDVRLDAQELNMLDRLASRNEVTRSEIMRKALRDFYRWNSEE